jgi:hypothetical protein
MAARCARGVSDASLADPAHPRLSRMSARLQWPAARAIPLRSPGCSGLSRDRRGLLPRFHVCTRRLACSHKEALGADNPCEAAEVFSCHDGTPGEPCGRARSHGPGLCRGCRHCRRHCRRNRIAARHCRSCNDMSSQGVIAESAPAMPRPYGCNYGIAGRQPAMTCHCSNGPPGRKSFQAAMICHCSFNDSANDFPQRRPLRLQHYLEMARHCSGIGHCGCNHTSLHILLPSKRRGVGRMGASRDFSGDPRERRRMTSTLTMSSDCDVTHPATAEFSRGILVIDRPPLGPASSDQKPSPNPGHDAIEGRGPQMTGRCIVPPCNDASMQASSLQ